MGEAADSAGVAEVSAVEGDSDGDADGDSEGDSEADPDTDPDGLAEFSTGAVLAPPDASVYRRHRQEEHHVRSAGRPGHSIGR